MLCGDLPQRDAHADLADNIVMSDLQPDALTWTALLGKWIEFAQASVALPRDAEGERWRASIPAIINLQAITFALGDLAQLPADERALARDRAEILIRENAHALEELWREADLPGALDEMIADAETALARTAFLGAVELIWPGPGTMIVPPIEPDFDAGGTLAMMQPGTIVMPGEPVAWWIDHEADEWLALLTRCERRATDRPQQVYREFREDGRALRDVIAPIDEEPVPGALPLLVPLLDRGRVIGEFTMNAEVWRERQERAMQDGSIPVVDCIEADPTDQNSAG